MGTPAKPQKMNLGLTVSCGRDNRMNNPFTIIISPQLPDKDPVNIKIPFTGEPPWDSAEDVSKKIAAQINKAGGKASAKSHTVSTGSKGGSPTTTQVCLIEIDDLASMDIGCDDGKVQLFDVGGPASVGGSKPGGGLKPQGGTKIKFIDCEEYRKKVEKDKEDRKRAGKEPREQGPNPGTYEDWFCNPDWTWTPLAAMRGRRVQAIAAVVVGTGEIPPFDLPGVPSNLMAPFMGRGWVMVPFCVIPDSLPLQSLEIRMRMASAGIVTSNRNDGVIEPLHFIAGHLEGEEVRAFGFVTPYDPLGYSAFPWAIVVGDADAVASHLAAASPLRGAPAAAPGGVVLSAGQAPLPHRALAEPLAHSRIRSPGLDNVAVRVEGTPQVVLPPTVVEVPEMRTHPVGGGPAPDEGPSLPGVLGPPQRSR